MTKISAEKKRYQIDILALEMLVCPLTKTRLSINADKTELISPATRVAYPITKGVPLLCLSESRTLSQEEIDKFK
ncbi:MAG: Trm112 family protein [Devosiaceae bacterium]|nr:Trm112 family protein [Devosiaceae bacterium]